MIARKKRNRSGVVSDQVIDTSSGKYKMIKTIGRSSDADQIEVIQLHKVMKISGI